VRKVSKKNAEIYVFYWNTLSRPNFCLSIMSSVICLFNDSCSLLLYYTSVGANCDVERSYIAMCTERRVIPVCPS
jgi:hypothetical protein